MKNETESSCFRTLAVIFVSDYFETTRLIRDGEGVGKGVCRRGKSEIIHLSLHCHHQNDSCFKMGSDESHFILRSKAHERFNRLVFNRTKHKMSS